VDSLYDTVVNSLAPQRFRPTVDANAPSRISGWISQPARVDSEQRMKALDRVLSLMNHCVEDGFILMTIISERFDDVILA